MLWFAGSKLVLATLISRVYMGGASDCVPNDCTFVNCSRNCGTNVALSAHTGRSLPTATRNPQEAPTHQWVPFDCTFTLYFVALLYLVRRDVCASGEGARLV